MRAAALVRAALLALALLFGAASGSRAQEDAAGAAWSRGDLAEAERLYSARLAADSTDGTALHRVALIRAWGKRYEESLPLLDRLLEIAPENLEARVDRARVLAWQGDPRAAAAALDDLLARRPGFLPALQARAQFLSWAGDYDAALTAYDRVLEIAPEERSVRFDRARVLSWASRFEAATEAYDSLLRADPRDREALLGLAQVLSWSARLDSAAVLYRRVLEESPGDVEALRGLARTTSWSGRLVEGERRWREALAAHPEDVPSLVGLAQSLRWQGRNAAALEVLGWARDLAPADRDVQEQLLWATRAMSPRAAPAVVYESDSDGNRITSTTVSGAVHLRPRLELSGELSLRETRQEGLPELGARVLGGAVTLRGQIEPGWGVAGTLGAKSTDLEEADPSPTLRAVLTSPGRDRVGGSLAYTRADLDGTALLVRRRVRMQEFALGARAAPGAWNVDAGASLGAYHGRVSGEDNRRTSGHLTAMRRVAGTLRLGAGARAFGFEHDLSDGYFDPDFFGLAEAIGRWSPEIGRWSLNLEAAPGMQQVRSDGEPSTSIRASALLAYTLAPGRTLGIALAFANSGLQQLSPTAEGDYRYHAVSVTSAWSF